MGHLLMGWKEKACRGLICRYDRGFGVYENVSANGLNVVDETGYGH